MQRATSVRTVLSLLLLALVMTSGVPEVIAQVPRLLNYQGVLSDQFRTAVPDGQYDVTFRLYDASTGGVPLWEETNTVTTIDGIFETILGLKVPITVQMDRPIWLGVEIVGEGEMTPRIRFVSTPYAFNAVNAESALSLDASALDVVHTLNGLDGRLTVVGSGLVTVTEAGSTITVAVPDQLPQNPLDGQIIRWNDGAGAWEAVDFDRSVVTTPRLIGDGTAGGPLDIAQMGATDGQPLVWNDATGAWEPGEAGVSVAAPLVGDGSAARPVAIQDGEANGQLLFWNGTAWVRSEATSPEGDHVLVWDAAAGTWKGAEERVEAEEEIVGDGSTLAPLRLAQQGAGDGEVLRWDNTAGAWRPGVTIETASPPLSGSGDPADPLRLVDGSTPGQILYWNGTDWDRSAPVNPADGWVLRWNAGTSAWEPAVIEVGGVAPLTQGAIWTGDGANRASELAIGLPNQVLTVNGAGNQPVWSSRLTVDSIYVRSLDVVGSSNLNGPVTMNAGATVNGNASISGDLTVSGTDVTLPAGTIDNAELANSNVFLEYGSGVDGDGSVALGDTLHIRGTGVGSLIAGQGIEIDTARGDVTVTNIGVRTALAGNGIEVDTARGDVTFTNAGVLSVAGTTNQVLVDTARGNVTFSLSQDIDPDATPTFDGIILDSLNGVSSGTDLLVLNGDTVETRTFASLTPGGVLPAGTSPNSTLRWDGSEWVENTGVTADGAGDLTTLDDMNVGGDLTVNGTDVTLPAGTIDNVELANPEVFLEYGSGVDGDGSVALGDTLHIRGTGVGSLTAGAGIEVDTTRGDVTVTNIGVRSALAGSGIEVDTARGDVTFTNAGVLSATGTANQVIVDTARGDVTFSLPQDIDSNATPRFNGLNLTGDATVGGDLTVNGTDVTLPAGTIDNVELANPEVFLEYGSGVDGDGSVALGDTLHIHGTGVGSLTAGAGIEVDTTRGDVTITNAGVLSVSGTPNQVLVDTTRGDVTLSLPQDIHTDATPTFDGMILDSLEGGSSATDLLVIGNDSVQTRTVASLAPEFEDVFWTTTGNDGTAAGTNFIGTTDNEPFEVHVDDSNSNGTDGRGRVMRYEPHASSPSIIGGYQGNSAGGEEGVTISGGGRSGEENRVDVRFSTIGGGLDNSIRYDAISSTVGGGYGNTIDTGANRATIAGGRSNTIGRDADDGTIGGGNGNTIESPAPRATIAGGQNNTITSNTQNSTIGGGINNSTYGYGSVISGGVNNRAVWLASIGGGQNNWAHVSLSTIAGGDSNETNFAGAIGGGGYNVAGYYSAIPGGRGLSIGSASFGFLGDNPSTPSNASGAGDNRMSISESNIAVFGNVDMMLANNNNEASQLRFYEANSSIGAFPSGTNYSSFEAQAQSADINYLLPAAAGAAGEVLGVASVSGSDVILDWTSASINVSDSAWSLTGNAGTNPGTNYVGTSDAQALHLYVNQGNSNALILNTNGSIQHNPGRNARGTNSIDLQWTGTANDQVAAGTNAVISGGSGNRLDPAANWGVVAGGQTNVITDDHSTISGGGSNSIDSDYGVIGGGDGNSIATGRRRAVIGGGFQNTIDNAGESQTIAGGRSNSVSSDRGTVGGGQNNSVSGNYATVAGGLDNSAQSAYTTIAGGQNNQVTNGSHGAMGGGRNNTIGNGVSYGVIGGGDGNTLGVNDGLVIGGGLNNSVTGNVGVIGGGSGNTVSSDHSAILGGLDNSIESGTNFAGAIVAGRRNSISTGSAHSFIGSGEDLFIDTNASNSAIAAGDGNSIGRGSSKSFIGAGSNLTIDNGSVNSSIGAGQNVAIGSGTSNSAVGSGQNIGIGDGAYRSFVGAGLNLYIENGSQESAIVAGVESTIASQADRSFIGTGWRQLIDTSANDAALIAGQQNTIGNNADRSFIGAGQGLSIGAGSSNSFIGAGMNNTIEPSAQNSTIGGGSNNTISNNATGSTIAGGTNHSIDTGSNRSTIGGGQNNQILGNTDDITIGGGNGNMVDNAPDATIGGGTGNNIALGAGHAVISGGLNNAIGSGSWQTTIGGGSNSIGSGSWVATIAGGSGGQIADNSAGSTIGGGSGNVISGRNSVIPGGRELTLNGHSSFGFLGNQSGNFDMTVAADEVAVFGNTDLWLANNNNGASQIRFYEANNSTGAFPNGTNYSSFEAQAQTADINYLLPDTAGIVGDVLTVASISGTNVTLDWGAAATASTINVSDSAWSLTGNAGTTAGTNYIGTSDAQGLHLYVNAGSDNVLVLNSNGSLQRTTNGDPRGTDAVDMQRSRNNNAQVASGNLSFIGGGANNTSAALSGGIVSGSGNTLAATAEQGFIGGGQSNAITDDHGVIGGGESNSIASDYGTIGGGDENTIDAGRRRATIAGGFQNSIITSGESGTIGGGRNNTVSGDRGTVGGGQSNTVSGGYASVAGGQGNTVSSTHSSIGGGFGHTISSPRGTIGGGYRNLISAGANASVIAGGEDDTVHNAAWLSTIGGGGDNSIGAGAVQSTIAGGRDNSIAANGVSSTISGGENNSINGRNSVIGGGDSNTIQASHAFIGGGGANRVQASVGAITGGDTNTVAAPYGAIGGGLRNDVQAGGGHAVIAGGVDNTVSGQNSAIPGGADLELSGDRSFGFLASSGSNSMVVSADEVALFGNTDLWLANNDSAASELRFYEANNTTGAFPGSANYTAFRVDTQSTDITYTLPRSAPSSNGQVLTATTGGVMSWASSLALSDTASASATLTLENTNATGTALAVTDGNTVLAYGNGTNTTIPSDVTVWVVNDDGTGSGITAALPTTATNGQFLYVLYDDADNGSVGGNAATDGDTFTFIYANGGWVLWN